MDPTLADLRAEAFQDHLGWGCGRVLCEMVILEESSFTFRLRDDDQILVFGLVGFFVSAGDCILQSCTDVGFGTRE
jgi:hypothetical protein